MKLLFVCTHNACRSILAEVITRDLAGGRIDVASAGNNPAGRVHPLTLSYLTAQGYRTEGLRSKGFDDLQGFRADAVITVCDSAAAEACPVWQDSSAERAHWGLPDPSHTGGSDAARERAFESVASTLRARLERLLQQPLEAMSRSELGAVLRRLAASSTSEST